MDCDPTRLCGARAGGGACVGVTDLRPEARPDSSVIWTDKRVKREWTDEVESVKWQPLNAFTFLFVNT